MIYRNTSSPLILASQLDLIRSFSSTQTTSGLRALYNTSRRELYRHYGEHFAGKPFYYREAIRVRCKQCSLYTSHVKSHVNSSWVEFLSLGAHVSGAELLCVINTAFVRGRELKRRLHTAIYLALACCKKRERRRKGHAGAASTFWLLSTDKERGTRLSVDRFCCHECLRE